MMGSKARSKYTLTSGRTPCVMATPAEPTFHLASNISGGGSAFITADLSQIASMVNRRMYRQGLEWAVAGIRVHSTQDCRVDVFSLPNTWIFANGYMKSYYIWKKMQDQILSDNPGTAGKYRDFKIAFDAANHDSSHSQYAPSMLPVGYASGGTGLSYEWDLSQIVVPNDSALSPAGPVPYVLQALGDDSSTSGQRGKGIIKGYAESRARPHSDDPNLPTGLSWMTELFDDGEQSSMLEAVIEGENDTPPYLIGDDSTIGEYYPGGSNQAGGYTAFMRSRGYITSSSSSANTQGQVSLPGLIAPCGLIRFQIENNSANVLDYDIFIDLVPGSHRGYAARPMTEMN